MRIPIVAAALLFCACLPVKNGLEAAVEKDSHLTRPSRVDATAERIASLKVMPGLQLNVWADHFQGARMLQVIDGKTVLLSRFDIGDVWIVRDADQNGVADARGQLFKMEGVHGLFLSESQLTLSTVDSVYASDMGADGTFSQPRAIVEGLPEGGRHPKRTHAIGPDGKLYVSIGSECNACNEPNREHATILRFNADGSGREIFVMGLRNTIGFDWQPETGELWGMDQGSDHRGDDQPPEELNRLQQGKDYGWPFAFGNRILDKETPDPIAGTKESHVAASEPSVLDYQAHSSPIAMVFLKKPCGPLKRGDAVVAMRGSWNRDRAVGYQLVAIHFQNGQPIAFEPLVRGFLTDDGRNEFGRPTGVAQLEDGSILFADEDNGMLYRLSPTSGTAQ